jgi:hypothetical protein
MNCLPKARRYFGRVVSKEQTTATLPSNQSTIPSARREDRVHNLRAYKKASGGRRPRLSEWDVRYFGAEVPPVAVPVLRPMFGDAFVGPAPLVTVS